MLGKLEKFDSEANSEEEGALKKAAQYPICILWEILENVGGCDTDRYYLTKMSFTSVFY